MRQGRWDLFFKDAPDLLKREGLLDLTPERERKLEKFSGVEVLLPAASQLMQRPIKNEDELLAAGQAQLERKLKELINQTFSALSYLAGRPAEEQHEFLCGIPEGFSMVIDNKGEFASKTRRYDIFMLLLMAWPEIAEMQKAEPPKNASRPAGMVGKARGKAKLVEDPKVFYELCGDIGLDLAPPGHPQKAG